MITRFMAENFRSIDDKIELSFEADTGIKDRENEGFSLMGGKRVLNAAAFFGANSSGKSNVFNAVDMMRLMVVYSVKLNDNERLPYDPYLLSDRESSPTRFEMEFLDGADKYRYGFSYTAQRIEEEWLEAKRPRRSPKMLLQRQQDVIHCDEDNYKDGNIVKNSGVTLNKNRLFLSLAAQVGGEVSKRVIEWFRTSVNVISGLRDSDVSMYTKEAIHTNSPIKDDILRFIRSMDVGFGEVTTKQEEVDERTLPKGLPADLVAAIKEHPIITAYARHTKYNANGQTVGTVDFDIEEQESDGTKKLFNLAGPIIDTLKNGKVLFIDELDSQMHPLLSQKIVELFNNSGTNQHGAQLMFTTHDTNMLTSKLLRRDQVMFVEKKAGKHATNVRRMMSITMRNGTKPRTDSNYEKNYLSGKYGAVPDIRWVLKGFEDNSKIKGSDE